MFKKQVTYSKQNKLSGADRKKVRRNLKEKLPTATDDDLDAILPAKGDLSVGKMASPSRATVYFNGLIPMIIDLNSKVDTLIPSVFALWQCPNLLPVFQLRHGAVSHYVLGGADLMLPGVKPPAGGFPPVGSPGGFAKGVIHSVMVPGNPAPIAVGSAAMSSTAAASANKGRLMTLLHFYGDCVWAATEGHPIPNEGFLGKVVRSIVPGAEGSESDEDEDIEDEEDEDAEGEASHETAQDGPSASVGASEETSADGSKETSVVEEGCAEEAATTAERPEAEAETDDPASLPRALDAMELGPQEAEPSAAPDDVGISPEEMDALLDACVLQALHTTLKNDSLLPVSVGTFWKGHVLPARLPGQSLDIKCADTVPILDFTSHAFPSGQNRASLCAGMLAVTEQVSG
ncbi:hypothetical protein CYMTET_51727 [Cymbomonas tetramitiformis]|uniref:Ligatin n=1 Tax=Cymbomonas tetramitiformis TaxID=36881 RepID=A0AAE0BKP1_9CHLO|nr:hypothetical protein CYMTET_51727 [Cymbomonas tetramitiformis]